MPFYSVSSVKILDELHPDLQKWLLALIEILDHKIIEGPRSPERQQAYFEAGLTKLPAGSDAPHLRNPCEAVHLLPWPWPKEVSLDSRDARDRLHLFAGAALMVAKQVGVNIRWGGDWSGDWQTRDNKFDDLMHFEIGK